MPELVNNIAFGAQSVSYNGVQFGGSDATFDTLPPGIKIVGTFIYDAAGTVVKGTRYRLTVDVIITNLVDDDSTDEPAIGSGQSLRDKLSHPRKQLYIKGFGGGFNVISYDIEHGPKPIDFSFTPLGNNTWHLIWQIEFIVKDCYEARQAAAGKIIAFNYDVVWSNDHEGIIQRLISGYAEMSVGSGSGRNHTTQSVDKLRDTIKIAVPNGFRREQNTWRVNSSKTRLDFNIVDRQLPGQAPPPGCTSVQGEFGFQSTKSVYEGIATMSMVIKTKMGIDPAYAGAIFHTAANQKQKKMSYTGKYGALVPVSWGIRHLKYDDSRVTMGSIAWLATGSMPEILTNLGIWEPLTSDVYSLWRASIKDVWHNRGVATNNTHIKDDDSFVIDLCDNRDSVSIGNYDPPTVVLPPNFRGQLAPPVILQGAGVITYKGRAWVYNGPQTSRTEHQPAGEVKPPKERPGREKPDAKKAGEAAPLDTEAFKWNGAPIQEYHHQPYTYVAFHQRAMRAQYYPSFPVLKTIQGKSVTLLESSVNAPTAIANCGVPIWASERIDYYRVNGTLTGVPGIQNPLIHEADNFYKGMT